MRTDDNASTSTRIQTGMEQIAALRVETNEEHIAEHIRGMVAATMGTLSGQSTDDMRQDAERWQQWALDTADGIAKPLWLHPSPLHR